MMNRARISRRLLCLTVCLMLVEGAICGKYETVYDCLVKHMCKCGFLQEYETCWLKIPKTVIDRSEKIYQKTFPNMSLTKNLESIRDLMCTKEAHEVLPTLIESYEDVKAYEKSISISLMHVKESTQLQVAKLCAMPLFARCMQSGVGCF